MKRGGRTIWVIPGGPYRRKRPWFTTKRHYNGEDVHSFGRAQNFKRWNRTAMSGHVITAESIRLLVRRQT